MLFPNLGDLTRLLSRSRSSEPYCNCKRSVGLGNVHEVREPSALDIHWVEYPIIKCYKAVGLLINGKISSLSLSVVVSCVPPFSWNQSEFKPYFKAENLNSLPNHSALGKDASSSNDDIVDSDFECMAIGVSVADDPSETII